MLPLSPSSLILDPATAELISTMTVATLLTIAAAMSLAQLPWSDEEIAQVDHQSHQLLMAFMARLGTLRLFPHRPGTPR